MKLLSIASIFLILSFPVFADNASHRKATEQMLLALNIDAQMLSIAKDIKQMQARQIQSLNPPPEAQPIIQEHLNLTLDLVFSAFKWEKIKDEYIDSYVSVYSEEEINDLLAFFKSKSGKKFIEKLPELNGLVLKVAEEKIKELQPQLLYMNSEFKKKLEKVNK